MKIYEVCYQADTISCWMRIWAPTQVEAKKIKKDLVARSGMGIGPSALPFGVDKLKPSDVLIHEFNIDTSGGVKAAMCRASMIAALGEEDCCTWENSRSSVTIRSAASF